MYKRRLRFNPQTQIYHIPSVIEEATPSELGSMWHGDGDLARAQREMKRTIRTMRKLTKESGWEPHREHEAEEKRSSSSSSSSSAGGKQHCFRGLEHYRSAAHLEQHRINRDCVTEAVLDEQRRQRELGIAAPCPERIAGASRAASEWARRGALAMGEYDERCARAAAFRRKDDAPDFRRKSSRVVDASAGGRTEAPATKAFVAHQASPQGEMGAKGEVIVRVTGMPRVTSRKGLFAMSREA